MRKAWLVVSLVGLLAGCGEESDHGAASATSPEQTVADESEAPEAATQSKWQLSQKNDAIDGVVIEATFTESDGAAQTETTLSCVKGTGHLSLHFLVGGEESNLRFQSDGEAVEGRVRLPDGSIKSAAQFVRLDGYGNYGVLIDQDRAVSEAFVRALGGVKNSSAGFTNVSASLPGMLPLTVELLTNNGKAVFVVPSGEESISTVLASCPAPVQKGEAEPAEPTEGEPANRASDSEPNVSGDAPTPPEETALPDHEAEPAGASERESNGDGT